MKMKKLSQGERTAASIAAFLTACGQTVTSYVEPTSSANGSVTTEELGAFTLPMGGLPYYSILLGNKSGLVVFATTSLTPAVLCIRPADVDGDAIKTATVVTSAPAARNSTVIRLSPMDKIIVAPVVYGYNAYLSDVFEVSKPGTASDYISIDGALYQYVAPTFVVRISEVV